MEEFGPIIVGIACLLGGARLLAHAIVNIRLAKNTAENWPTAYGKVLKSSKRMANFGSPKSQTEKANSYLLDFEYEYVVKDIKYTSTKPLFFGLYVFDEIEEFLARYPKGKNISVYYEPKRPHRAVIETTLYGKSGKHEFGFGMMLILLGSLLLAIRYDVLYQWVKHIT